MRQNGRSLAARLPPAHISPGGKKPLDLRMRKRRTPDQLGVVIRLIRLAGLGGLIRGQLNTKMSRVAVTGRWMDVQEPHSNF